MINYCGDKFWYPAPSIEANVSPKIITLALIFRFGFYNKKSRCDELIVRNLVFSSDNLGSMSPEPWHHQGLLWKFLFLFSLQNHISVCSSTDGGADGDFAFLRFDDLLEVLVTSMPSWKWPVLVTASSPRWYRMRLIKLCNLTSSFSILIKIFTYGNWQRWCSPYYIIRLL